MASHGSPATRSPSPAISPRCHCSPHGDRNNAYQEDYKGRFRVGWTPDSRDQYTFTYANQKGQKGNPPYAGTDPVVRPRFWQWPYWDKESFYFVGNKGLGEFSYLRARLYYDKFDNLIKAYDNNCYCTQRLPPAFTSPYDDDTYGTTLEFGTRAGDRQSIKSSFYFKDDTHREGNLGEPPRSFRDRSFSFGFEDTVRLSRKASAILGFSADSLQVLNAENFVSGAVLPFLKTDVWAYNPQAGLFYAIGETTRLHFTFARKTRLPTIKDRYSYRMGQGIPNPDLREERANNWEVGASRLLGRRTFLEANLFRSDVSNSTQRFFVQPNVFQLRNLGGARFLGAEFAMRTSLTRALHLQGRYFQNDGGRYGRASDFTSAGFGAMVQLYRRVELQAGMDNAFDRNYILVDGYPEAGRTLYVNLRYRF